MSNELGNKCQREKYWKEKTSEEKIEHLAKELTRTEKQVAELCSVLKIFKKHIHVDNKMFIPLSVGDNCEQSADLYFRIDNFLIKGE